MAGPIFGGKKEQAPKKPQVKPQAQPGQQQSQNPQGQAQAAKAQGPQSTGCK